MKFWTGKIDSVGRMFRNLSRGNANQVRLSIELDNADSRNTGRKVSVWMSAAGARSLAQSLIESAQAAEYANRRDALPEIETLILESDRA